MAFPLYYHSRHFDALAAYYDAGVMFLLQGKYGRCLNAIYNSLPKKPRLALADFGCGTGKVLSYISRRKSFAELYGIDLSSHMLYHARKKFPSTVQLFREDIEATSFLSNSLDCVLICWTLHELPVRHIIKVLREIKRVLKPGGKIVVFDFHKSHLSFFLRVQHCLFEKYIHDFYQTDLTQTLSALSFVSVKKKTLWHRHLQLITAYKKRS